MKITFTGTGGGGAYHHDRGGASVMIEGDGGIILFDCGNGVMRQVFRSGVDVGDIKAVFISHLHYDHTVALPEFFNMLGRRKGDPPKVFGPAGIAEYVENSKKLIIINELMDCQRVFKNYTAKRSGLAKPIKSLGSWPMP